MPRKRIDPDDIPEDLAILNAEGEVDEALDPGLDHDSLLRIYRAMVLTRKLDERMIVMQRQGRMGTFAPGRGQEAAQIGSVFPLQGTDWFAPSYRSLGAQVWRGWTIEQLLLLWDGFFGGFRPPEGVNDLPFSIVVGSHVPLAVGVGLALNYRKSDAVVLTNFGDGAASEGDVNEALNFAAVYQAPVIFVCENNGYAISLPVAQQTRVKTLAHRALGFGMPGLRVDGNDVLAMIVGVSEAIDRARAGKGPTFIEAVTYRLEMHTTADDPKIYRDEAEVEQWQGKDPIRRLEKYLLRIGAADQRGLEEMTADAEEQVRRARERFDEQAVPQPREVFDYVYADLPAELGEQQEEYLRKLDQR
ncbi:MAG: pyruvate dehydrogenase (acetyl-transferring) E1 component subunit alpha, partial [Planctomycetota bacterium]